MLYDGVYGPVKYGTRQEAICIEVFHKRKNEEIHKVLFSKAENSDALKKTFQEYTELAMPFIEKAIKANDSNMTTMLKKAVAKPIAFTVGEDIMMGDERSDMFKYRRRETNVQDTIQIRIDPLAKNIKK